MSSSLLMKKQTAIGTVTATDADGDALVYSISDGGSDIKVLINANSGVLTFSSAPDKQKLYTWKL